MKKLKLSILALVLLVAIACNKANNTLPISNNNVTNAEAADMVAGSVSLNSNGVANVASDAALNATAIITAPHACGTIKSDSLSRQSTAGSLYQFNYNLNYKFVVNCDTSSRPDSLSSTLNYSGSFSGPNLSSTNSGSSIFTVNGLLPGSPDFIINGEYKRSGSFSSKIDTTNHGNSNIDIVINSLTVQRPTRNIISGNAAISITGDVPKKGSFTYTGTLVFNNNGTATLTLNGTVYIINLNTGVRTKV